MARSLTFSFLGGVVISCAIAAGCDGQVQPSTFFISGISPRAGTMLGGTPITISGGGFLSGAKVEIGGIPVEAIVVSDKKLTVNAPAHAAGAVNVAVINPPWQRHTRWNYYTFEIDPAFTISGTVTEMTDEGEIPVEGVEITETGTRTFAITDATGAYRLGDLRRAVSELWFSKPGYVDDMKSVTASSDMRVDLRVERIRR